MTDLVLNVPYTVQVGANRSLTITGNGYAEILDLDTNVVSYFKGGSLVVGPFSDVKRYRLTPSLGAVAYSVTVSQLIDRNALLTEVTGTPQFSIWPNVKAALAAGQRATIAIIGDSVPRGWGTNGAPGGAGVAGDAANQRVTRSWPQQFAAMCKAAGVTCRADAWIGTGNTSNSTVAELLAANPNVTGLTGAWSLIATTSIGGKILENSTDTTPYIYTPEENADKFFIQYNQLSGYATFTVTDASGTLATINAASPTALGLITVAVTRPIASKLPISIQRTGVGANLRLIAVIPTDTTEPGLEILNCGAGGFTSANWNSTSNAVSAGNAMIALAPTQYVIQIGPNDANGSVTPATYQANMSAIIDRALAVAPVSLVKPPQAQSVASPYNIPAGYLTAIDDIVYARPAMTVTLDFNSLSWAANDYFDTSVHTVKGGSKKMARHVSSKVRA